MMQVSATIITLNEEDRIGETVSSLGFCDEVLVVDSGSTDRTCEIALACGARVLTREWTGYSDQKNYAADQVTNDWVFSVDADERPGIQLSNEIIRWKSNLVPSEAVAWSMPRRVWYLGKWINHSGWYPDRKVRLYDRRRARWKGDWVHERLEVDGSVTRFDGDLLHFPYRSLEEHHGTIDRYTSLAAAQFQSQGRGFNPLRLFLGPPLYFIKSFLIRGGLLDGFAGLRIATMGARYIFIREFRILRRWK